MSDKAGSTWQRAVWLARRRPAHVLREVRGYFLFYWARCWRCMPCWRGQGLELERNVRLQRNSALMAEAPHAAIRIGADSIVYEHARLEAYGRGEIAIGAGSIVGDVRISARGRVAIGERFLSSWNVFIQDYDPHPVSAEERRQQVEAMTACFRPSFDGGAPPVEKFDWEFPADPIEIGDDVWIGANSTILKGAQIGSGSVVAAGSVVLKGEYPERSLLAGNPAAVIRQLDSCGASSE